MPFNATLILALAAAVGVSTLATAHVRAAAADLNSDVRERIYRALSRSEILWRALEWGSVAIILVSMFTNVFSRKLSDTYVIAACGAALMCAANAAAAFHTWAVYAREAPGSPAHASAKKSAWIVALAELALVAVLFALLNNRVNLTKYFHNGDTVRPRHEVDEAGEQDEQKGLWLDENIALQELSWLKKAELDTIVGNGGVKTKTVAGKILYNADAVERLKKLHRSNANIPD